MKRKSNGRLPASMGYAQVKPPVKFVDRKLAAMPATTDLSPTEAHPIRQRHRMGGMN